MTNFKFLLCGGLIAIAPAAFAANSFNLDSLKLSDVKAMEISTVPVSSREEINPAAKKEWTIMVFMNAKSNVESFGLADMNEMEAAKNSDNINVVAELGRMNGQEGDDTSDGNWTGTRRYLVRHDDDMNKITSPVLEESKDADMGDYRRVIDFVQWSKRNFPAKRYMLILWDHGWGWIDPVNFKEGHARSISHDFQSGHYIKTTELKKIFQSAGKVDMYASMACFMQMMEVAYEIKDYADVVVGSEEVIQLASFDFTGFLNMMAAAPSATPKDASRFLTETFKALYLQPGTIADGYAIQLSSIKTSELDRLAGLIDDWAKAVMHLNDTAALKKAKEEVVRFEVGDASTDPEKKISFYGDLYHFIEIYNRNMNYSVFGSLDAQAKGEKVMKQIKEKLVLYNVYLGKDRVGNDFANTHGISINLPGRPGNLISYNDTYQQLEFAKRTCWKEFCDYLKGI